MSEAWTYEKHGDIGIVMDENGLPVCMRVSEQDGELIASAPALAERVRILREALALCESRLSMPWVERHLRTNEGDLTDLGEALRDIRQALEATKEAPC